MNSFLLVLLSLAVGYALGAKVTRKLTAANAPPVPEPPRNTLHQDHEAYDMVYSPEQRARNQEQLRLMDEFAKLQRERNNIILRAQTEGMALLDCDEMKMLKVRTVVVLKDLIEFEPEGFYKDLYGELMADVMGAGDEYM